MTSTTSGYAAVRAGEPIHSRLLDFAKTALIKIFLFPYAAVCELYCGKVSDVEKYDDVQIGHFIGIDEETSGIREVKEAWEDQRKAYPAEFLELDPCTEILGVQLQDKCETIDVILCMQNLQLCFESEEKARILLHNVSSMLKPGGYFIGITPDSSTLWAKCQKNIEAYHNRSSGVKPNIVPNCIRSDNYMITFEVEEEKFPLFGKKYQLRFSGDISAETHCLVHFPSLIRLAREAGLEYVEIQNLTEFYDDNRTQFASLIMKFGPNLADPRGKLLPRSYDVLGLYSTFIFQKPDPDMLPPLMTPTIPEGNPTYNEREQQVPYRREDETASLMVEPSHALGKISEQKGILGPGPAELRFSDPF